MMINEPQDMMQTLKYKGELYDMSEIRMQLGINAKIKVQTM